MNNRVLLAMSGGIDSTVAAILLQEMGLEVLGITFKLWDNNSSLPKTDFNSVKTLASKLGIDHKLVDLSDSFIKNVLHYFRDEYLAGNTPFPCAVCNKLIKWSTLDKYASKFDCDHISSGHYVKKANFNGVWHLKEALDKEKDQSFFLWHMSQQWLKKCMFPLGNILKKDVRKIAQNHGFMKLLDKKESTGPCFISSDNYRPFLIHMLDEIGISISEGNFIDHKGNTLGKHQGYPFYTIGQRRGLGINLNKASYVTSIDADRNLITLGEKQRLFKNDFYIRDYYFQDKEELDNLEFIIVKIRYRKQATSCKIEFLNDSLARIQLNDLLDSIAPGQAAVFYKNDLLLGGGFIHEHISKPEY